MGNRGAGVAQVGGDRDHPRAVDHPERRRLAALQVERNDGAESALLTPRQAVLRMGLEARVVDLRHGALPFQPGGQLLRTGIVLAHAQLQGLHALQEHPGVERRQARAGGTQEREHLLADALGVANDGAADATALPVQVLGGRVHDQVCTQLQRLLQHRSEETVVHDQQRALAPGNLRQPGDVHHLAQRIGGCLDKQEPGPAGNRGLPGRQVAGVNVRHLHAKLGNVIVEQRNGRAKQRARDHHVVALLQQHHAQRQDRGHAAGRGDAGVAALHRRQALFERLDGRVGES